MLLKPKCNYVLINRNGEQFSKLSSLMSKIVFDAIRKYINPTRHRQIIETESSETFEVHEQEWVSEDQKHSSNVARLHYRKKRSRDVAEKGQNCLKKPKDETGKRTERSLASLVFKESCTSDNNQQKSEKVTNPFSPAKQGSDDATKDDGQCKTTALHFMAEEDRLLKLHTEKRGYGRWKSILMDSELEFKNERTTAALKMRAVPRTFLSFK